MQTSKQLEDSFKDLAKSKELGHAYLFYGGAVGEQFEFAKKLANYLETSKWEIGDPSAGSGQGRPLIDAMVVEAAGESISIETSRTFLPFLSLAPVASAYRTLIINGAGELTPQAQNAILKVCEEPPAHALVILIVQDINVLLPALLSRFQKIYFAPTQNGIPRNTTEGDQENGELVRKFMREGPKGKSDIIKALVKEEGDVDGFIKALIAELAKQPMRYSKALQELVHRNALMQQFSTNRRLQLEAVLQYLE